MEAWEYWRKVDEFNIVQGALMAANLDPNVYQNNIENRDDSKKPEKYEPLKRVIISGISSGKLDAKVVYYQEEYDRIDRISLHDTLISHESLANFLKSKNINSVFFNYEDNSDHEPLTKTGKFYSPKLAAAIEAWQAVIKEPHRLYKTTPKQALIKWLEENAEKYELINDNGTFNKSGIEEVAKIANWKSQGGAPLLTAIYSEPEKESSKANSQQTLNTFDDLDSEFPF